MPEQHAHFAPSAAHRWMACPGSLVLAAGCQDDSSPHAREGTAAHELAAAALLAGNDAQAYLGRVFTVEGQDFTVDEDMAGHVQRYLDYVRDTKLSLEQAGATVELRVEERVDFSHVVDAPDQKGTADAQLIAQWPDGRYSVVTVDLKYGRGVQVNAEGNAQLQLYTIGTVDELALLGEIRDVTLVVHQPRLDHVDEWATTHNVLHAFAEQAREAADLAREAQQVTPAVLHHEFLHAGESQCRWCPAKAICPKLADTVAQVTQADFDDLTVRDEPAEHAAPELGRAMSLVDLVEGWCKAVRAETERRLLAGTDVPGWKLVQGRRGARKWADDAEAETALKSMRLKQEQMYDFKLISPTTAEKLHKAGALGPRQYTRLQDLITQPEGKPSVAPAMDKRPALAITPTVDDFADLT